MPVSEEVQNAIANEARRSELRTRVATLRGTLDCTSSLMSRISTMNADTQIELDEAQGQLAALEAGAGPGVTDDYGAKSSVTQLLESIREAANGATVDYIKANPECSELDAAQAWDNAASQVFATKLLDGLVMGRLYRANMLQLGYIVEDTWEAQRSWFLTTPKEAILTA